MNKTSILARGYNSYKTLGLTLLICRILQKFFFASILFLNKRRVASVTKCGKRIIKEINGSKMYLDVDMDDGLCRFLTIADIREAYITETMKNELQKCNVVVDIGANIGYYALLEAKILGDKGKVYAIEPVAETIELLKENVQLNRYTNIEIHQLAIGDKTGVSSMYVGKWKNRSQIKDVGNINGEIISHEVSIPISTLDDFLEGKPDPDVIRMDVEGYEYNVIKGMKRTLEKRIPLRLFIEFHFRFLQKEKCLELLRTLKRAGFEIADATYEVDEKCITQHDFVGNIAAYLTSKMDNLPVKGHLKISIDDILSNAAMWNGKEGALDLCMRLGALEILFTRTIPHSQN